MVQATSDSIVHLEQLFAAVENGDNSEDERGSASEPMRARKRRRNPFILDEAEEGDERETHSPSLNTSPADHTQNSQLSISEDESTSDIDSEDSFLVDDDCYE